MNRKWLGAGAALVCLAGVAHAEVDPAQYGGLHWRLIGPFRGGRALAATGVPGQPEHFYFGSVNGGVWESRNAGRTWTPIFDSAPVGSIGAIAVAPSAPNVLYVGTGEADMRSDIAQGSGAFRSSDGGKTWSAIGLADTQQISKIIVDPRNPDVVLAAALGHPYGPNAERGVFRSEDGGRTWSKVLYRGPDIGAVDLVFEPGNPDVVYASLWATRRPPWSVYPPSTGPGGGVWKSIDGGKTWAEITANGLPSKPGHIGLAISPAQPKRVYALVDARDGGGLYRSDDAGAHFAKVSSDKRIWERGWYFGGITAEPKDPDTIYICDVSVYRSTDGGKTFAPVKGNVGGDDYHLLWIDPDAPNRRILASDQGTVVSVDGGTTWSSWFNQPTGQFYHVVTDNRFPYWVYGAQQDSGAAGVPSRNGSLDGINMTQFREITAGGESDNVAPDPDDPETIFGGRVDKLDTKTGQTRSVDPTLAEPDLYRRTWTLPLVFSKRDPKALYFANQRIFRTRDGGELWSPISPDLTRPDPGVPANLDPTTAADDDHPTKRRGVVYAIAPSPAQDGLIWAGTDDGLVWRSTDDGAHWSEVTPKGLAAWSKVGVVEASPHDPQAAYLAVDRHRLDDFKPYVYRTHDGGKSWTLAAQGLDTAVNVVREDPVRKGLLYAGTERGIFVSFDDGDHWQPLQANLPRSSIRDIDVHGDDLVVATHGRAFWVLDDISPLRELAADASKDVRLFTPAEAFRVRAWGFTGSPMPSDEPRGANPPSGAIVDYWLPAAAKGPVVLTILDEKGQPVRRYTSAAHPEAPKLSELRTTPEWAEPPAPPSAEAGMHRYAWDLHYAKPAGDIERDDDEEDAGVWAPPGRYQVELTVDGQTFHRPLELKPDPRIKPGSTDYAAEFELARRIEALRLKAAAGLKTAVALHEKLAASTDPKAKALDAELVALADIPTAHFAPGNLAPQPKSATGLPALNGQLGALARAVDGADGGPSPDAKAGLEKTSAALDATLARLEALKARAGK